MIFRHVAVAIALLAGLVLSKEAKDAKDEHVQRASDLLSKAKDELESTEHEPGSSLLGKVKGIFHKEEVSPPEQEPPDKEAQGLKQWYAGWQDATTLGDRLSSYLGLHDFNKHVDIAEEKRLAEELLKASGAVPKDLGDKVSDTLESLHLKKKDATKVAAERLAEHLPHLAPEEAKKMADELTNSRGQGSAAGPSVTVDSVLKALHIRNRSDIEKAEREYTKALAEMKAELEHAAEASSDASESSKTTLGRLFSTFNDATSLVKDSTSSAYEWLAKHAPGKEAAAAAAHTAASSWESASARTADALLRARDNAAYGVSRALETAHLKEPQRTKLEAARDGLDRATRSLMESLGYHHPTLWERTRHRAYSVLPESIRPMESPPLKEGIAGTFQGAKEKLAGLKDRLAPSMESASASASEAWDSTLKSAGLREHTATEKALAAYHETMDSLRSKLHLSEPKAAARLAPFLEEQRGRLAEAAQSAYEALPPHAHVTDVGAGKDKVDEMSEAALDSAAAANRRMRLAMDRAWHDMDSTLKSLGLRDKSVTDAFRDNATQAWHVLKVSMGMEEPTGWERMRGVLGMGSPTVPLSSKMPHVHMPTMPESIIPHSGPRAFLDRTLKSLGLRPKSAVDRAREAYEDAAHRMKVTLGREEPHVGDKLVESLGHARARVGEATKVITHLLPKGGVLYPAGEESTADAAMHAARGQYEAVTASAMHALLLAQHHTDLLLKRAGLRERGPLERAKHDLDVSMHDLWMALGWEQPKLQDRILGSWHRAKVITGLEEPTLPEKVRARIDSMGDTHEFTGEGEGRGFFANLKHRIVGA